MPSPSPTGPSQLAHVPLCSPRTASFAFAGNTRGVGRSALGTCGSRLPLLQPPRSGALGVGAVLSSSWRRRRAPPGTPFDSSCLCACSSPSLAGSSTGAVVSAPSATSAVGSSRGRHLLSHSQRCWPWPQQACSSISCSAEFRQTAASMLDA